MHINHEVGYTVYDADDTMAAGFSWIPPLAVIESFGGKEEFMKVARTVLTEKEWDEMDVDTLLTNSLQSKYDYKRFFKAKK